MASRLKRVITVFYFSFWISVFFTRTAHAYIDPATTSYIFQIVAGLFIAFGAAIVVFWKKIRIWVQNMRLRIEEAQIKRRANKTHK